MYVEHFGFREAPFELTANPRFLFMTAGHREALANLQYGLSSGKTLTVLTGQAGTGKTTLLRAVLDSNTCRAVRCVYLVNPGLTRSEFVQTLASGFDLSVRASESKAQLLAELESRLAERRGRGEICALVVDEAQRLSDDLLEEVRLLTNLETRDIKLLPLVLAGQPELADRLNQLSLTQLKQRVALRCQIVPFDLAETAGYIATRISVAGGQAVDVFTREAVMLVHQLSGGIARTINVVCDNALLSAFASGRRTVTRAVIEEVGRDFDLRAGEPGIQHDRDHSQVPDSPPDGSATPGEGARPRKWGRPTTTR